MCGYSTTSYPRSDCVPPAVATPFRTNSAGCAPAGGRTLNVTVVSSSSRPKWWGADGGSICHPAGADSATVAAHVSCCLLDTVARMSMYLNAAHTDGVCVLQQSAVGIT